MEDTEVVPMIARKQEGRPQIGYWVIKPLSVTFTKRGFLPKHEEPNARERLIQGLHATSDDSRLSRGYLAAYAFV